MTERTDGASVTVPVFSSTVPVLACAMFPTNAGSWNSTGPEGWLPLRESVTDVPLVLIESPRCFPAVVGKLATEMTCPPRTHESGTPRPITRLPSDRCAASESSSTMLALAMPQACGDEPFPASG